MTGQEYSILIADDELIFHELVKGALGTERFSFQDAYDGEEALKMVEKEQPDLIICDVSMPRMDGLELIRRLQADVFRSHIPLILLTSQDSVDTTVAGLEAGAADYITKPFRFKELRTRVLCQLRRRDRDLCSDPLTQLPSGMLIRQELTQRIERGEPFAAIYADLDFFKPVVDKYGFVRAGDVVKRTADVFYRSVTAVAKDQCFVGHIAGDDFMAICPPDLAVQACEGLIERFDKTVPEFYDPTDVARGYIEGKDRDGKLRCFSLLSVSLCIVDSRQHVLKAAGDVAALAFDARHKVKAIQGSAFIVV